MKSYPNADLKEVQILCKGFGSCDGCPYQLNGGCLFQRKFPWEWPIDEDSILIVRSCDQDPTRGI